jgi:hypothetical protein
VDQNGLGPGPEPPLALKETLLRAEKEEDWAQVSALLCEYPRLRTGVEGALLRARCWLALGEQEIAAEFQQ